MARRNFYEIINESPLNLPAEYERLRTLYYEGTDLYCPVEYLVERAFEYLPEYLIGRTISLEDFNKTYGFNFPKTIIADPELHFSTTEYLFSFCEYVWNFCEALIKHPRLRFDSGDWESIKHLKDKILGCMSDLGHVLIEREKLYIFVPADPAVVSVAEISSPELAVSILEYHHHALKGNLAKKKAILKLLADDIEPCRAALNSINKSFSSTFFQMLQKFVRHNNEDNACISSLSNEEIEAYYDDIYQMWLLAKLELDNVERKKRAKRCLEQINS